MTMIPFTSAAFALSFLLSSSLVAAQQGDGGAATGNIGPTADGGSAAGAAGKSTASVSLSTGATIAIAVVVSIVCVLGILTAVLFFVAKKRQWTIRETLRRSTRRVTTGIKNSISPLTPARATFSPGPFKTKFSTKETKGIREPKPLRKGEKNRGIGLDVDMQALNAKYGRDRDVEKGEGSQVVVEERKNGHRPQMPSVTIPKVGKKYEEPKTPMYNKMFGRD